MSYQLIPYVAVVEIDGETHVLKATGVPHYTTVKRHIEQIHPNLKIVSLEKADPKDPIGHIQRAKNEIEAKFPDQEPLTPERLAESANAAAEAKNAAQAERLA